MILTPGILALLGSSLLVSGMLLYAARLGVQILRDWDITSGSETQLRLERQTYLVSTLLANALLVLFLSFFLFIYTADRLHPYFTGAMCAAGSLNASVWGYPVLLLKLLNVLLVGLWLIVNFVDHQGYDYPLIRFKYRVLLVLTPLVLVETAAQGLYFRSLRPELITSCCGALFSSVNPSLAAGLLALPVRPVQGALAVAMAGVLGAGARFWRTGKGGYLFAGASLAGFFLGVAALISFISIYIYELPSHHCPFCLLQREYGYVGYPLYLSLLGGAVCGLGVGVLLRFRGVESLADSLPGLQRTLALLGLISYAFFSAATIWLVLSSNLSLS